MPENKKEMADLYVGLGFVRAYPDCKANKTGYHVIYPDGCQLFVLKSIFEAAYRKITSGEKGLINNWC